MPQQQQSSSSSNNNPIVEEVCCKHQKSQNDNEDTTKNTAAADTQQLSEIIASCKWCRTEMFINELTLLCNYCENGFLIRQNQDPNDDDGDGHEKVIPFFCVNCDKKFDNLEFILRLIRDIEKDIRYWSDELCRRTTTACHYYDSNSATLTANNPAAADAIPGSACEQQLAGDTVVSTVTAPTTPTAPVTSLTTPTTTATPTINIEPELNNWDKNVCHLQKFIHPNNIRILEHVAKLAMVMMSSGQPKTGNPHHYTIHAMELALQVSQVLKCEYQLEVIQQTKSTKLHEIIVAIDTVNRVLMERFGGGEDNDSDQVVVKKKQQQQPHPQKVAPGDVDEDVGGSESLGVASDGGGGDLMMTETLAQQIAQLKLHLPSIIMMEQQQQRNIDSLDGGGPSGSEGSVINH